MLRRQRALKLIVLDDLGHAAVQAAVVRTRGHALFPAGALDRVEILIALLQFHRAELIIVV